MTKSQSPFFHLLFPRKQFLHWSPLLILTFLIFNKSHVPKLAVIAAPLYALVKKFKRFTWEKEQQDAFDQSKVLLQKRIVLSPIEEGVELDLYTDASMIGIGACLMQKGKICDFFARRISPVQQNYSTTMRETYAMVESILHYRVFLIGVPFTVWTDHKPLIEWFKLVPGSQIYATWMVKLQGLTFDVKYIEGDNNVMADLMSRPFEVEKASLEAVHEEFTTGS